MSNSDSLPPRSGLTRRRVLKIGAATAGIAAVAGVGGAYGYRQSLKVSRADAKAVERARIVVAGGSIAGLTVAARLIRAVPGADITVIEPKREHHYQPGYTLVSAGVYEPKAVVFDQKSLMLKQLKWVPEAVARFEPEQNRVITSEGRTVDYDFLIVALGVETNIEPIEGLREALETPFATHIYQLEKAIKFRQMAKGIEQGKAVFTYPAGYVKCGGAPQKTSWLAEDLWRRDGKRDKMEVHFYTPQSSLFPVVPVIDEIVKPMMEARGINNHYFSLLRAVDPSTRTAIFEETSSTGTKREVRQKYDLLHAMPHFRTPLPLRTSDLTAEGLGGQVEVDRETLCHKRFPNVFALGDCAGTGAPKTAATVRKQAPAIVANLIDRINEREFSARYDGTSGCPLLTRYGRCMMFEFDFKGQLVNEWIYQSTKETRLWWNFKVHGLKRLYLHAMMNGFV